MAVTRTSKTMLNNSGKSGNFVFVLDFRKKCFQFFTTENDVCGEFVVYDLYYVEAGSFYVHFLKSLFFFIINGCQMLSKTSYASTEETGWLYSP